MPYMPESHTLAETLQQPPPITPRYQTIPVIGKKRPSPEEDNDRPTSSSKLAPSSPTTNEPSTGHTNAYKESFKRQLPFSTVASRPNSNPLPSYIPSPTTPQNKPYRSSQLHSHSVKPERSSNVSVVIPNVSPPKDAIAYYLTDSDDIAVVSTRTQITHDLFLVNAVDSAMLPKSFTFVREYKFVSGTKRLDREFLTGCTCPPNNGRDIGCEYVHRCECLEDSATDKDGKRLGYPYGAVGADKGLLVGKFLKTRHVIYECSVLCGCCVDGRDCRNVLVQKGRTIPLEIFRTADDRGWGLRCPKDVRRGQFIDTYLGEVITSEEADRREEKSNNKDSYLFTLDKFRGPDLEEEDLYVVDGEFMGGPTRFINHSCDPNCGIWCVSTTRGDAKVYELAFFALQDIPAGTELTFDYLGEDTEQTQSTNDADKVKKMEAEKGKLATKCLCGSEYCRGFLWL